MKPTTDENLAAAIARAAEMIPGARLEVRPAVEHPTIVLPIPGLSVRFKCNGHPTMALRRESRDREWCNIPTAGRDPDAGARRIVRELTKLVTTARSKTAKKRERDLDIDFHLGCWLTATEAEEATKAAGARGMSVSGLLRRGLRLALEERPPVRDEEAALRGTLRLLVASHRDRYPDNFTAIAEHGSVEEVVRALRVAFRANPDGIAAAGLLGLNWVVADLSSTAY
jgi:hypothetical protein